MQAYLTVPLGPGPGPAAPFGPAYERERAGALEAARRTAGAWPEETREEYVQPEESGWVIPVPRSMSGAEADGLTGCVVSLAPLDAAARARLLAYLNSLFPYGP